MKTSRAFAAAALAVLALTTGCASPGPDTVASAKTSDDRFERLIDALGEAGDAVDRGVDEGRVSTPVEATRELARTTDMGLVVEELKLGEGPAIEEICIRDSGSGAYAYVTLDGFVMGDGECSTDPNKAKVQFDADGAMVTGAEYLDSSYYDPDPADADDAGQPTALEKEALRIAIGVQGWSVDNDDADPAKAPRNLFQPGPGYEVRNIATQGLSFCVVETATTDYVVFDGSIGTLRAVGTGARCE